MIIVEGADNVGKTTLIKQLLSTDPSLRLLKRERFKPGKDQGSIAQTYLRALLPANRDRVRHANSIADRFFASECIYGELFRGGCRMSPGEHLAILQLLRSYHALVVYCAPPRETVLATWTKREQAYDNPGPIYDAYQQRIADIFPGLPIYLHDWTTDAAYGATSIVNMHRHHLHEATRALTWWGALPFGVGPLLAPTHLIVGESFASDTATPFTVGESGDFFARAFAKLPTYLTNRTYFTPLRKDVVGNVAALREELAYLQPQRTIALGRTAAEILRYLNVPFAEVPHPTGWFHFHHADLIGYVKQLQEAFTT